MHTTRSNKKEGFTILEILITISIVAIGFAGIFSLIQNSSLLINQSKANTIAINLTREAIEIIHNIRDTNWQRRPGQKDDCRLKKDPLSNEDNNCTNDEWIQEGWYTIRQNEAGGQKYFALEKIQITGFENKETAITTKQYTELCIIDGQWANCNGSGTESTTILRAIQILGLYDKTDDSQYASLLCENGESIDCGTSTPKELRFCAHTHYIKDTHSHIQLCSIITNFQE